MRAHIVKCHLAHWQGAVRYWHEMDDDTDVSMDLRNERQALILRNIEVAKADDGYAADTLVWVVRLYCKSQSSPSTPNAQT